ncbi:MAG: EamA family transporter [Atopobiaceae bacterium]|nr:EamA family transporter [Atopobiaceae bacterium]
MELWWPIGMIVVSNLFYHICTKGIPAGLNPFLSLVVTYVVGMVLALGAYFLTRGSSTLAQDVRSVNWAPIVLGLAIVGLEAGNVFMYRAGWDISVGSLLYNILLAVILVGVGALFYHEQITPARIAGVVVCCVGLWLLAR